MDNQQPSPQTDTSAAKRLSAEDQARVDQYLQQGINKEERRPFRPWLLLAVIVAVLSGLSLLSLLIARTKLIG